MAFKKGEQVLPHKGGCLCFRCNPNFDYGWNRNLKCPQMGWHLKGRTGFFKGKKHTEKTKMLISLKKKGIPSKTKGRKTGKSWNKGLTKETDSRIATAWNKGKKLPKLSAEQIREKLRRREKSSLELKFENVVVRNNLPYRFVGNGEFFVGRKCPDFVNTNGQKIAVEVYYRKHKELFGQAKEGIEKWKENRSAIFAQYGWVIEYFDEIQVNEREILARIG